MEERILVEGKFSKNNTPAISSAVIALLTLICSFLVDHERGWYGDGTWNDRLKNFNLFFYFGIPLLIFTAFFYFWMSNCSLTVTSKRIYGKSAFGVRVDLPLDMISATAMGMFNSIAIATASGKISFWLLKNCNEVFSVISNLLIERQSKDKSTTTIMQESYQSNADELIKYKGLLDNGVISQEEFDAKKKQLLGL